MKKLLSFPRLVICFVAMLSLGVQAADPVKLRVGVEGAYPPFSQVGADGKIKGFDIDIANALCAEIKAQCTLVQLDFDGMIPALQSKKIDLIVASMSITPERSKVIAFTDKYYNSTARLISKSGLKIDGSPESFKGKKIGVQRGTIHDRFVTDKFKSATLARYAKQDDVFLDLVAGRIDATLVDGIAGDIGFLKTPAGKGYAFTGPEYDDVSYFGTGVGIGLRKGDTGLRDQLNGAIKSIRTNGIYKKLQDQYFDFDLYGK